MSPKNTTNKFTLTERQAGAIERALANVFEDWVLKLRCQLREFAKEKLNILENDRKQQRDFLSLASRLLRPDAYPPAKEMEIILANVRRKEYSISDLFVELCCLEEAIQEFLQKSHSDDPEDVDKVIRWVQTCFREIFQKVLNETSIVYERVAETGPAYCQVDTDGIISYANEKMHRILGVENAKGLCLSDFFGEDSAEVSDVIHGKHGQEPLIRQFNLTSQSAGRILVHAEIAPLYIDGKNKGAYATLTDMSQLAEFQNKVFESSRVGIIRVNPNLEFTYVNPALLEMTGAKSIKELYVWDLVKDEESRRTLTEQFDQRKKGASDEYEIKINRVDDGRSVPVSIAATPEFDNTGKMIGAFSIVRNLESQRIAKAFRKHIETCRNWKELLTAIAEETARIVPYELFIVSKYSQDLRHSRAIFDYPEEKSFPWPKRWFPMTKELRERLNKLSLLPIDNIQALLNKPEMQHFKEDKTVKLFIKRGIKSYIRYPFFRANKPMAAISLMSKKCNAFADAAIKLKALPFEEAINTVMYYLNVEEQQFRFELIKKISNCQNTDEVINVIVKSLVKHYKWPDVGIFSVDEVEKCFRLRAQAHSKDGIQYDDSLTLTFNEGVIGETYRKRSMKNVGNVLDHADFVKAHDKTRSELCIPIELDGRIRWLLNIEDTVENAFSRDDEETLQDIVDEAHSILEHLFAHFFLDEFIDSASDAIFVTNRKGQVLRSNKAAAKLLGYRSHDEIENKPLENFIDEEDRSKMQFEAKIIRGHYNMIRADNHPIEIFLSGGELHADFECKVFCAKDLSLIRRVEELEATREMFHEITTQTRTPFSLLFTWLRRLHKSAEDRRQSDLLEKAIHQLRKIELTYEKLILYDAKKGAISYNPVRLDLSSVIHMAVDELPHSDRERIVVNIPLSLPDLSGDLFQLAFVFQTILSYLLRFAPVDEQIPINVQATGSTAQIRITGFASAREKKMTSPDIDKLSETRAQMDITLGDSLIRQFIEDNHSGSYEPSVTQDGKTVFLITLPIVERED